MGSEASLVDSKTSYLRPSWLFENIWRSLILLYIPVVCIISFLSYQIYYHILESNYRPYFETQQNRLDSSVNTFSRELGHIQQLIRLLRHNQQFESALKVDQPIDRQSLVNVFTDFSKVSKYISQIRWIDKHGLEKVRINVSAGEIEQVKQTQLQDKSKRSYFQAGMKLGKNNVFISAINPNIEKGKVVLPLEKTIRAVMHTKADDGVQDGVLIINFVLNDMLESLSHKQGDKIRIIDNEGYWIVHPNPSLEFRAYTDYIVKTNRLLAPELIKSILEQQNLHNFIKGSRLISYSVINIGESDAESRHRLFFIDSTAPDFLSSLKYKVAVMVFTPTVLILLIIFFLIWRFLHDGRTQYDLFKQLQLEKKALAESNQQLKIAYEHQQQMQDSMVELRKLSSMGMMVAGLAHELNTPLGGTSLTLSSLDSARQHLIQAVNDGLKKSELEDYLSKTAETIALAKKNVQRAAELVSSFKRLAVDRHTDEPTSFDLMLVIQDVVTTSTPRLKKQHINLDIIGPQQLMVQTYVGIISQLFDNFINNALSHGFADRDEGQILIEVTQESINDVSIVFSDNGQGIEPERLTKIFDPFETGARGSGHTGLGLHLCHQWVTQLLKGSIRVRSEPGQGTRFILVLPVDVRSR